jgi:hypothetical protein
LAHFVRRTNCLPLKFSSLIKMYRQVGKFVALENATKIRLVALNASSPGLPSWK